ncbi:hypothetical protein HPB50_006227 [Hyalomma asiaticum]|uniref:Uncharacterized protein n=1 Tax=Hyalomma asiaticum TaxID=266040 RepID=A0ACB7SFA8_HYAAI|nr:hypothetical protein HPB50_006227 [Hyalomma asiaticum]
MLSKPAAFSEQRTPPPSVERRKKKERRREWPSRHLCVLSSPRRRRLFRRSDELPGFPAAAATARSPLGSPSFGQTAAGTESAELYTNDQGPVTLFTSLMAGWAGSLCMGTSIGYSLPAGHNLSHARGNTTATGDHKLFWFDSLLPLGAAFGVLWGCCLAFLLGRRRPIAIASLGSFCAWLVIHWASDDSWSLYTARFLVGTSTGVVSLVAPAYIAEIATAKDRGKQTGIAAGMLYAYVVGQFTDWSQTALWCAVPSALSVVLTIRAVESPRWLMEQGRHDDAQIALRRLRFITSQADGELQAIEVIYVKSPTPLRHYMLAVMMMVLQQFSGVNVILNYATGPLHTAWTSASHDFYVVLAIVQLVCTGLATYLLDIFGRLKPLAVSVTICACSMVALGSAYLAFSNMLGNLEGDLGQHLAETCKVFVKALAFGTYSFRRYTAICNICPVRWVQVVFCVGYSIGLGPATWVLTIELAPLRGSGCDFGTACVFHWASALAVMSLVSTFGFSATSIAVLAFFAGGATFVSGFAAFFLLPDTSCLSLETILLEGQKEKPKRPMKIREVTSSSITPPQKVEEPKQKEEGNKKEQENRKVVASGHSTPVRGLTKPVVPAAPAVPAAPTAERRTPHISSHMSRQRSRAHHSRADARAYVDSNDAISPNEEGHTVSTAEKLAPANNDLIIVWRSRTASTVRNSARSDRLTLPPPDASSFRVLPRVFLFLRTSIKLRAVGAVTTPLRELVHLPTSLPPRQPAQPYASAQASSRDYDQVCRCRLPPSGARSSGSPPLFIAGGPLKPAAAYPYPPLSSASASLSTGAGSHTAPLAGYLSSAVGDSTPSPRAIRKELQCRVPCLS